MRARGRSQQALCCFTDSESGHPDALDDVVASHRGMARKHVTRRLNHPGQHGTHTKTRLPPHSSYTINISNVHLSHRCATRRLQTPFHWPLAAMPRAPAEDLAHPAPFRSDAHAVEHALRHAGYEVLPLRNAEQAIVATPEVKGLVRSAVEI